MGLINVTEAIGAAESLFKEEEELGARKSVLRTALRDAVTMGEATPEQAEWIGEAFPARQRKTPAERLAEAEAKMADLKAKVKTTQRTA